MESITKIAQTTYPMNIVIAHFNTHWVDNPGGVEKSTCQLANALRERGHKVTILYRDGREGPPYFPLDESIPVDNILFENGKKVISDKLPPLYRMAREIARIFGQNYAQGINAEYKGKQYGEAIKRRLAYIHPDIIVSTSIPSTEYILMNAGYTGPLVTMIHSHPEVQFPPLSKSELKAAALSSTMQILLPSGIPTAKQYFPNLPIKVIGNSVEIPEYTPHRDPRHPIITSVGTFSTGKNQRLLVAAFRLLADHFPDWTLELWGFVNKGYAQDVKKNIVAAKLEDRILLKGRTEHVLEDSYSRSDIFATTSLAEGFGLSAAEAMAAGIPAVGLSNCHGISDLIQNGKNGFLTDTSAESVAEALAKPMSNDALRKSMGAYAKESMKQYSPVRIYDQWESLLMSLVKGTDKQIL